MIDEQITRLDDALEAFAQQLEALDKESFLAPLGNWTARDIVAHLVGWNRHVITGSRQLLKGELPFYDTDPGDDFANVNSDLIRRYPSRDRKQLVAELRRSKDELVAFLRTIDELSWAHDFGVRHKGETITIRSTVDDLIADYAHHREQLEVAAAS